MKVPVVESPATVTEAGIVSVVVLSDSVTALPPAAAALESVTVQVVLAFDARLEAAHCKLEIVTDALSEMVAVLVALPSAAVIIAV